MPTDQPRLLIFTAHPDDAEYHAGGLATIYRLLDREVKIVSLTDGRAGHYEREEHELIPMRRREAAQAGRVINSPYETLDFPDGQLQPTLEARHRVIQEIRQFQPDLVLTHRTCDYHPDHRAVGHIVQDASYLITVPRVLPEIPALRQAPVFAFMPDMFTRPARLRADEVLDVTGYVNQIVAMLACHVSQVFEWLPYEEGTLNTVPRDATERIDWVRAWYAKHMKPRADHFRNDLQRVFGTECGDQMHFVEVFEISEYGTIPDSQRRRELFPHNGATEANGTASSHLNQLHDQLAGPHGDVSSVQRDDSAKLQH